MPKNILWHWKRDAILCSARRDIAPTTTEGLGHGVSVLKSSKVKFHTSQRFAPVLVRSFGHLAYRIFLQ
jgi:hypothetical protein